MHRDTLDILRCPYCGGRLSLVTSLYHRVEGDGLQDGILGCHCCIFPVVAGIPVLHLQPASIIARGQIEKGEPGRALRTMFGLENEDDFAKFDALASSERATYREIVEALGSTLEGGYFLYRFTDPGYLVAHALVRAVAGTVLRDGGRAIDICGGSGHLTRALQNMSSPSPVLADLSFVKIWLAKRFTAPGCEPVCCDGNTPLPFARGAFGFAMCADASVYIWTKRLFVLEMLRLIDADAAPGAALISHAHNQHKWSPSHGQPLPPEGYRNLFERYDPCLFAESGLFEQIMAGGPLDLSHPDPPDVLDRDPALVMIASRHGGVLTAHPLEPSPSTQGEFRLNPLYVAELHGDQVHLRLRFPSEDYEQEFGACRRYLPEEVAIAPETLAALEAGDVTPAITELLRRRVVLNLPRHYY